MQPAASFPQAKGRQGTEGRWQIDREGALRGETTEMRKDRTHQAERAGPPPSIKGCYGREMTEQHRKRWGLSAK